MKNGGFKSIIDPKPPLNEESEKENLEKKSMAGLLERE